MAGFGWLGDLPDLDVTGDVSRLVDRGVLAVRSPARPTLDGLGQLPVDDHDLTVRRRRRDRVVPQAHDLGHDQRRHPTRTDPPTRPAAVKAARGRPTPPSV